MSTDQKPTPTRGVGVMLDRERFLRYSLKTRKKLREEHGAELLGAVMTDDKLVQVLLIGFHDDDPDLTVEQLEDLIDMENLPTVVQAMSRALGGGAVQLTVSGEPVSANPPAPVQPPAKTGPTGGESDSQ